MSSLKTAATCRYTAVPITIHQAKYLAHTLALRDPDVTVMDRSTM
jgi:hypothetical protein